MRLRNRSRPAMPGKGSAGAGEDPGPPNVARYAHGRGPAYRSFEWTTTRALASPSTASPRCGTVESK